MLTIDDYLQILLDFDDYFTYIVNYWWLLTNIGIIDNY